MNIFALTDFFSSSSITGHIKNIIDFQLNLNITLCTPFPSGTSLHRHPKGVCMPPANNILHVGWTKEDLEK